MLRAFRTKSIFVGIYGGILLTVVAVSFLTYITMHWMNNQRAQEYTERMSTAVFHITAIAVARQKAEQRALWLQDASLLIDAPLQLISALPISPTGHEEERLAQGYTVVRTMGDASDIYIRVPLPGKLSYLTTRIAGIGEQQARAAANFYLEDLANYPGQEEIRLKTLSPFVGFPMAMIPLSKVRLDRDQRIRLEQDEIVVSFGELSSSATRSAMTVYAPSQNRSGQVLMLGPFELFDPLPFQHLVIACVIALFFITLGAYWVIHNFEIKVVSLGATVQRLREGDLTARADVSGSDEIGRLAETLNQMTAHIKRLLDSQRELTQAVSHELRTPLARLRFGMEMMAGSPDEEDRFQQLELLDEDINQLNQLIDEILTYATLQQSRPQLSFEPLDMTALMGRIQRETDALRKPAKLTVTVDDDLVIQSVERYAHRVIQNLVGNALRYANHDVRATLRRDGDYVVLWVEDDGPGIPEAHRERIFEPFTRLDDSRTRSTGGYGLGLSIVSRIVHWFEGTIYVDQSHQLGGARFIMRWPVSPTGKQSALT
ncbi:MAG: HAMP domain-containing protein [Paraperlucidibaca sp.]|jgi:two-component system sensor histidine kinase RstB|uniref:ATP-binding protein n=1 Tax=Paraperlucidibaca sp. TaxID=2708021 RepID=UPI001B6A86B0|nr:HAMP domain-containing protein [Paraperlucidibaca sp.]MBQ0721952.1 HAMP domain-containing protein [Paraperlucidibaca sp.]MBQ0843070.1 HAMP domain-containing protein [Paraperlucidibaca sp.]